MDELFQESKIRAEKAGPVVEGLPAKAVPERFEPGCAAARGEDCFLAGHEWQRKAFQEGGKETESPAAQLNHAAVFAFERGCALGHGRSCVWLGHEVERGVHTERDVVRAASLLEKGCTIGESIGCRDAADMLETGRKARPQMMNPPPPPKVPKPDLPRDPVRAIALYLRACELGERDSCFIAARLLAAGEGMAPDRGKALALFVQLCDDGMALACTRAAALEGEADYLRRACVLGGADDCVAPGK
jgi:TPR repeat protein